MDATQRPYSRETDLPAVLAVRQRDDAGEAMVSYQFDAAPGAVRMAVPRTYDRALFQAAAHTGRGQGSPAERREKQAASVQRENAQPGGFQSRSKLGSDSLPPQEYRVTVIGVAPHPAKRDTSIIAGRYEKGDTHETEVVAVRVNDRTLVLRQEDERVLHAEMPTAQEGQEIVVSGEKSKHGVIRARVIRIVQ